MTNFEYAIFFEMSLEIVCLKFVTRKSTKEHQTPGPPPLSVTEDYPGVASGRETERIVNPV